MAFELYSNVILTRDVVERGRRAGDVGTADSDSQGGMASPTTSSLRAKDMVVLNKTRRCSRCQTPRRQS